MVDALACRSRAWTVLMSAPDAISSDGEVVAQVVKGEARRQAVDLRAGADDRALDRTWWTRPPAPSVTIHSDG